MTFAAVGSAFDNGAATTSTVTVSPAATGNLVMLAAVSTGFEGSAPASVSGGNCTWAQVGTTFTGSSPNPATWNMGIFAGTATATGSATATVTWTVNPIHAVEIVGQQFSSSAAPWAIDGSQGNLNSAGGAVSPSLTPAAAGDLYFVFLVNTGTTAAGSTSGYTYFADWNGDGMAYNPACTSAAQAPGWGDSGEAFGIAVLMKETGGAATSGPPLVSGMASRIAVVTGFAGKAGAARSR